MRYQIKVTGQNPAHPHLLSVCVNNKGYYYNKLAGTVSTYQKRGTGFILVSVKDTHLIDAIKTAVNNEILISANENKLK